MGRELGGWRETEAVLNSIAYITTYILRPVFHNYLPLLRQRFNCFNYSGKSWPKKHNTQIRPDLSAANYICCAAGSAPQHLKLLRLHEVSAVQGYP